MITAPAHARLAPSASKRWMACPGSIRMTANLPRTTSEYAELGTAAHLLFEMCMRLDDAPEAWLGRTIGPKNHIVDTDMTDAVGPWCGALFVGLGHKFCGLEDKNN